MIFQHRETHRKRVLTLLIAELAIMGATLVCPERDQEVFNNYFINGANVLIKGHSKYIPYERIEIDLALEENMDLRILNLSLLAPFIERVVENQQTEASRLMANLQAKRGHTLAMLDGLRFVDGEDAPDPEACLRVAIQSFDRAASNLRSGEFKQMYKKMMWSTR